VRQLDGCIKTCLHLDGERGGKPVLDGENVNQRPEPKAVLLPLAVERGFDWKQLLISGASLSLFSPKKLIELRIPGGKPGVWIASGLGFLVVLGGIVLSLIPPGDSTNKLGFELKLIGGTVAAVVLGLVLYFRGVRDKSRGA